MKERARPSRLPTVIATLFLSGSSVGVLLPSGGQAFASPKEDAALQGEMRDAFQTARSLFSYTWSDRAFAAPENKEEILQLVKELSRDFHKIEKTSDQHQREPGFDIILKTQQEMLQDVADRFAEGKHEYAQWRLKGILQNCAACHSRVTAPYDFSPVEVLPQGSSIEERTARAELLFASRQFERALDMFFSLAQELAQQRETTPASQQALKQWLVIQVRVKDHWPEAAANLQQLKASSKNFTAEETAVLQHWIDDLKKLDAYPEVQGYEATMQQAAQLFKPVADSESLPDQDRHLVTTLRATALLHSLLEGKLEEKQRRQALLLLAKSYAKLPILSLDRFSRFYLERVIREHPDTDEAREAYTLLNKMITLNSSGSGGTNLVEEDVKLLDRLRKLSGEK